MFLCKEGAASVYPGVPGLLPVALLALQLAHLTPASVAATLFSAHLYLWMWALVLSGSC